MHIERFRVQGFKSLVDVTVEGLAEINVFFGLNDVGKSNIFQALNLCSWLLIAFSQNDELDSNLIKKVWGQSLFRHGGDDRIRIEVDMRIDDENLLKCSVEIEKSAAGDIQHQSKCIIQKTDGYEHSVDPIDIFPDLIVIGAKRRFRPEHRLTQNADIVTSDNLKQALFYAYLSSDLQQKQRLAAIRKILAEPPFTLGELDVALDPATDEIDIGFVRFDGRLPLENLGSGAQQLLLILGQVFLNDASIVVLEEPEMNLSPQYQESLMLALRTLMQDPAVQLEQLFISTHSSYLEFTENFYDVTMDVDGATHVASATAAEHANHFAIAPVGPEHGARLNSLNQITLYDRLIEDLGLQRGDLVIFTPNEQGRWEVRAGKEVSDELEKLAESNGSR